MRCMQDSREMCGVNLTPRRNRRKTVRFAYLKSKDRPMDSKQNRPTWENGPNMSYGANESLWDSALRATALMRDVQGVPLTTLALKRLAGISLH